MARRSGMLPVRLLLLATVALLLAPTLAAHAGTASFFLGRDGTMTGSAQPRHLLPQDNIVTESFDGPVAFRAQTGPLTSPLRIARAGDAFELHLEDREKLIPTAEYHTHVRVRLADAHGQIVRNADGSAYYLAEALVASPSGTLQQFRVVTFPANASGPLATDGSSLVVPAGLRIELEFGLSSGADDLSVQDMYTEIANAAYDTATEAVPATGHETLDALWARLRDETLDSATDGVRDRTFEELLRGGFVPASTFEVHGDHPDASRLEIHLG